jgi:hypothetical protein
VVIYVCVYIWDLGGWEVQTIGGGRRRVNIVKKSWNGTTMYFYGEVVLSANRPILLSRRAGATAASISVDDPSFSRNVDTSPHDFTPLHLFTFLLSSTFSLPSNKQSLHAFTLHAHLEGTVQASFSYLSTTSTALLFHYYSVIQLICRRHRLKPTILTNPDSFRTAIFERHPCEDIWSISLPGLRLLETRVISLTLWRIKVRGALQSRNILSVH